MTDDNLIFLELQEESYYYNVSSAFSSLERLATYLIDLKRKNPSCRLITNQEFQYHLMIFGIDPLPWTDDQIIRFCYLLGIKTEPNLIHLVSISYLQRLARIKIVFTLSTLDRCHD